MSGRPVEDGLRDGRGAEDDAVSCNGFCEENKRSIFGISKGYRARDVYLRTLALGFSKIPAIDDFSIT